MQDIRLSLTAKSIYPMLSKPGGYIYIYISLTDWTYPDNAAFNKSVEHMVSSKLGMLGNTVQKGLKHSFPLFHHGQVILDSSLKCSVIDCWMISFRSE